MIKVYYIHQPTSGISYVRPLNPQFIFHKVGSSARFVETNEGLIHFQNNGQYKTISKKKIIKILERYNLPALGNYVV